MWGSQNAELNPVCHLLSLLGAHHILHVSRIRVKKITADWNVTPFSLINKYRHFRGIYCLSSGSKKHWTGREQLVSSRLTAGRLRRLNFHLTSLLCHVTPSILAAVTTFGRNVLPPSSFYMNLPLRCKAHSLISLVLICQYATSVILREHRQ
jgi:hypothetical protein